MLAKFGKRSPDEIAGAVQDFALGRLGISEINSLRNLMPQPEEIEAIKTAQVCISQIPVEFTYVNK